MPFLQDFSCPEDPVYTEMLAKILDSRTYAKWVDNPDSDLSVSHLEEAGKRDVITTLKDMMGGVWDPTLLSAVVSMPTAAPLG